MTLRHNRVALLGVLIAATAVSGESFVFGGKNSNKTMCWEKQNMSDETDAPVERKTWNPLRLGVLRLGLTEPAMTSSLNYGKYNGVFRCAYCGNELFDSNAKYDSGSGWPSFWRSKDSSSIAYKMEFDGRLECKCKKCNSHLGHVFLDGPRTVDQTLLETAPESDPRGSRPNGPLPRFCINGAALTYHGREESS